MEIVSKTSSSHPQPHRPCQRRLELLSHPRIALEATTRAVKPQVMAKATSVVDPARVETLFQLGEQDAAAARIAPDADGETPAEGAVWLDQHGTPR